LSAEPRVIDPENKEVRVSQLSGRRRSLAALAGAFLLALAAGAAQAQQRARGDELRPDLIYHNYCSVCHGDRGDGRSRAQASFNPPPADLTTQEARKLFTRERMIAAVTYGKSGTAMTSWTTQLTAKEIEAVVDFIRDTMMAPEPGSPLAQGRAVYGQHCIACHGERGQGVASPAHPAPKPFVAQERERMIAAVAEGRFGSLNHAFSGRLKRGEIANAVDYIRKALAPALLTGVSGTHAHGGRGRDAKPAAAPAASVDMTLQFANGLTGNAGRGKRLYHANCAACHGDKGDGQGPRARFTNPKPRNFLEEPARSSFNRPALYAAVSHGLPGTEMPGWSTVLTPQQMADVSEYVLRTFIQPAPATARR
jgi:mono/diheme cytochrome c family protein